MAADALKIVYRDPAKLKPHGRNARTHSPEQVKQIRASIEEFGFTNPVLLRDDGQTIGAGHGRHAAALLDPPFSRVPTITITGLTETQWRAYMLADNKLGLNAGWDTDMLRLELGELRAIGFDLNLTGFDGLELRGLMRSSGTAPDPDDAPDPPAVPVSREGDLWLMGDHRLACGSSTDAATAARVLAGIAPHLMVTDPPYGVNYDPGWRPKVQNADGSRFSTGKHAVGVVENDDQADWREAWALFPGDVAYVWHAGNKAHIVAESLISQQFEIRAQVIWNKHVMVIGRGHYHPKHEPCWYAVRKGSAGHWQGDRKQTTVWDLDPHRKSETGHSTQKPIDCMKRPIENNSAVGDWVYEPFSGSGTTIIAAEMTGRHCAAIEINPAYCDVAIERWQKFSGGTVTLQATGQTFAQVKAARSKTPRQSRPARHGDLRKNAN